MNPKSHRQARWQVRRLLKLPRIEKSSRYLSASTKKRTLARAEAAAEAIWRYDQVGIWRWQLQHVRWYLAVKLSDLTPRSRYQHFLAVQRVLVATDRSHWLPLLSEYSNGRPVVED